MAFRPDMASFLTGIRPAAPLIYRAWPGVVADLWQAEADRGGRGHYRSSAPRIVAVLGPRRSPMRLACGSATPEPVQIVYVPAGVEAESRFDRAAALSHLDLHFDAATLTARLTAAGHDAALLDEPRQLSDAPGILGIADLLAQEIRSGTTDLLTLDSLTFALVGKLFATTTDTGPARGGLADWQVRALDRFLRAEMHRRISVAEMAHVVGLSESWFARAHRQSRGETPQRRLQRLRVETAMTRLSDGGGSLAEVSASVGFSDQAHFTRAFRNVIGKTPGAWRREVLQQDRTIPDCFNQDRPT